ncbi:hypothetical protein [Nocardia wallacei]|uniref:hypothetical protein n=1 Tax=Nocardia wallacei TaxID=480035 RepID=UPI002453E099|nr:hypothetical protein [Nocardia wallacei]
MTEQTANNGLSVHEQMHFAALAACATKKERIRYACEQLGNPTTAEVIAWLKRYGETTSRPTTSTVVNEWKRERGLGDTGTLPKLSDDVLAELDAANALATEPAVAETHDTAAVDDPDVWAVAAGITDRSLIDLPTEQLAEILTLADESWTPMMIGDRVGLPGSRVLAVLEAARRVRHPDSDIGPLRLEDTGRVFGRGVANTEHEADTPNEHSAPVTEQATEDTGHRPAEPGVSATAVATEPVPVGVETEHVADTPNEHSEESGHVSIAVADTVADTATGHVANTPATVVEHRSDNPVRAVEPVPAMRSATADPEPWNRERPAGAIGFYLVAVMSLFVSLDTSWLFFGERLGIENVWIRGGMFAVLEAALLACGVGMAAAARRNLPKPGSVQLTAWALCGVSAWMAISVSGPVDGPARVMLGPVMGMLMFHHALGIEKRAHTGQAGALARLGREMRERVLSRLGLADDDRDAARRTRDRAARRVARLSLGKRVLFRDARLARALAAANVAHDDTMRTVMLAELATRRHARELATLAQASPWTEHADTPNEHLPVLRTAVREH